MFSDGDARAFADKPDVIAYANTEYSTSPSEFQITAGGSLWRYYQWIALMSSGSWIEAKTTVDATSIGVQFRGDTSDGYARVLVDGSEVWNGDTYGADANYPGKAFVKYLEISGLASGKHTIRVECMGKSGAGGGVDVTIFFFGLKKLTTTTPTTTSSAKGLVAYYPFDGDTRDHSGNGNDATNYGATFVPGVSGQALSFDGLNDYVYAPVNINPDVMPQMTMMAWARPDKAINTIISHDNGGFDRTIDIDNRGGGLGWSAFSGTGGVLGYHPVTIGKWDCLAAVYDQSAEAVKLYVNDAVKEKKGSLGKGWNYTHIGSNPSFGAFFAGTIDEVRIYSYALSASEIKSICEGKAPPVTTQTPAITIPAGFSGLIFESRSKSTGSTVQIPLTLQGIKDKIGNMDITLSYDPSVLEATDVIKGGLTANSLFDYNIQGGTIKISLADNQGFSGDGLVANIVFNVIGAKDSTSPLKIQSLSANRADLSSVKIPTQDGLFTVSGIEQSKGDCNGDGKITSLDALCALQMSVGKKKEDLANRSRGFLNTMIQQWVCREEPH